LRQADKLQMRAEVAEFVIRNGEQDGIGYGLSVRTRPFAGLHR
jgi:hypothetical protein